MKSSVAEENFLNHCEISTVKYRFAEYSLIQPELYIDSFKIIGLSSAQFLDPLGGLKKNNLWFMEVDMYKVQDLLIVGFYALIYV